MKQIRLYGYAIQLIRNLAILPSAILLCTNLHSCNMAVSYRESGNFLEVVLFQSKVAPKHSKIDLTMKHQKYIFNYRERNPTTT